LRRLLAALFLAVAFVSAASAAARIKDITAIQGVRDNQLIGYGLVIGLAGTGDSLRGSPFTEQSLRAMLEKMGVSVPAQSMRARNVAAIVATATLPPFIGKGGRVDVSISSLGDASSLAGGTLLLTPLIAVDGYAYAVAQGPISVSGFTAAGQAESLTQGVPTAGRIANGALIERELKGDFNSLEQLSLQVLNPDFATAVAISDAINAYSEEKYKTAIAEERNLRTIAVTRPKDVTASRLMAEIGDLVVEPDAPARIVIDEKAGTIVIGAGVKISRVAVTHGSLTVRVTETPTASQPPPLSSGETVVTPETQITTREDGGQLSIVSGTSLEKLVDGLNRLGVKPTGIIAILQAIKSAGAMHAELVVQ
jgi:flagellar P-ring protein precursor FlgI